MRNTISCVLVCLLTLGACSKDNLPTTSNTLNGKWKLVKYFNLATGANESEPSAISRSIVIEFSDNGTKGSINGQTVTNTVGGEYELLPGNKMRTLSFGGTKVAEPNWGNKFWVAVHAASSYKRQGDKLFILFNVETEKMEFKKQ